MVDPTPQQYFPPPAPPAGWSPARKGLVAALAAVGLVTLAGLGYGGLLSYRAFHEYVGGCTATQRTAGDLADSLAPAGFRVAGVHYFCNGDLSGIKQDEGYLVLRSDRTFGSRDAVWQTARDTLATRGWSSVETWSAPDAVPGGADAGLTRARFDVDLIARSTTPAALELRIRNLGRQTTGGPDHDRLAAREASEQDQDQLARTPRLSISYVPPGTRRWRRYVDDDPTGSPIEDRRTYWLVDGGGKLDHSAEVTSELAEPGLDLATGCGAPIGLSKDEVTCRLLGTTANGHAVYLPEIKADGSYGPAMAVLGGALVRLEDFLPYEDTDPVPTPGPTDRPLLVISRSQLLTLFGSINVTPGAVRG